MHNDAAAAGDDAGAGEVAGTDGEHSSGPFGTCGGRDKVAEGRAASVNLFNSILEGKILTDMQRVLAGDWPKQVEQTDARDARVVQEWRWLLITPETADAC